MTASSYKTAIVFAVVLSLAGPLWAEQKRERPAKSRQAEITLRLIEASATVAKAGEDAAQFVPAELKNLLRFKNYTLIDSAYLRGREGETLKIALAVELQGRLRFRVDDERELRFEVEIEGKADPKGERSSLLETETTLNNGETVVLGASRMQGAGKALIVLLTARLIP